MTSTRIAVLVGSLRAESVNRKIAELLRDQAADGVELDIVSGLEQVPFYEDTLDATNTPQAALDLRERISSADAVLAVTPEYNGTMPAVLKNAIDWLSRPYGVGAIAGKPFGVIGTASSPYGGKWAHEDAQRSAGIAGAVVVEGAIASESGKETDPTTDAAAVARLQEAVANLVAAHTAA